MSEFLNRTFRIRENKSKISTEILAGFTTFFTMAYIIFVNPDILGDAGMNGGAVMIATCISAAVGTILIGLFSNYPFAQAPGMGLNAFFAYTICGAMGFSVNAALAAVFISGLIFILVTVTGLRKIIMKAIPLFLKQAISVGIGLFIAYIGLINSGLINTGVGVVTSLQLINNPMVILSLVGLAITIALVVLKVKGGLLISIGATAVIGVIMGLIGGTKMQDSLGIHLSWNWGNYNFEHFGGFVFGFKDLFTHGSGVLAIIASVIAVLLALTMVDMFDTMGTLIGTAEKGGFLDKDGNLPRANRAMLADAIATSVGAVFGTSTVTTYVESTSGVAAGGKTGLTSMVVGLMFLVSIALAPALGFISGAATAPILIIVGVFMITSVAKIQWTKMDIAIPAFLTIIIMPLGYSIADGIAWGFISHVLIRLILGIKYYAYGRKREQAAGGVQEGEAEGGAQADTPSEKDDEVKGFGVHPLLYVFAALFILRYVLIAVGTI